ncbi:hypothetical protein [Spirobacillus cienkowskii]|uniref:hypothetical protein n=1 Tax=Spirobacillus cienkowskii TaxID=495820 RepID=UPI0030CCD480
MNVNKRLRKANLLSTQNLDLRSRKSININKINNSKLRNIFIIFKKIFLNIYFLTKTNSKTTYLISIIIICLIITKTSVFLVNNFSEKILPSHISIETDNKIITEEILREVIKELEKSKKNSETRTIFLKNIHSILASKDIIDQYWIRLGLDAKLQINAIMHIPIVLLETKNGDRFVVSNNLKIIAKNPAQNAYSTLIRLEASELKIQWKSKNIIRKNKKNSKIESSNHKPEPLPAVNFPWLITQTKLINSEILNLGTGYSLNKIYWDSNNGFILKINRNNILIINKKKDTIQEKIEEQITTTNEKIDSDHLIINVGDNHIKEKIEHLKLVLTDLTIKNIYPTKVDLDFNDKASFKIPSQPAKSSKY